MRTELTRIVADAMANGTYGVNAQLPNVPKDAGDPVPPDVVEVVDDTRHDLRQRQRAASAWPVLAVYQPEAGEVDGEVSQSQRRSDSFPVLVEYQALEAHTAAVGRDASYTLRAILRTLDRLQADETARTRNQVQLEVITVMRAGPPDVIQEVRQPQVAAAVLLDCQLRDFAPTGP